MVAKKGKGAGKKAIEKKSKRAKARNFDSYKPYIYKVLKEVHPHTGITAKAMSVVNSMVQDVFERVADEAVLLAMRNRRLTVTAQEIQTATRLIFPGDLATHAVSEGVKAVKKFYKHCE